MKILTFTLFYTPGYQAGGAIVSISNLVASLGNEISFRIVTTDRDINDVRPYPGVSGDIWFSQGKAKVRYLARSTITLRSLSAIADEVGPDIVYLNSFFDRRFTLRWLLARKLRCVSACRLILAPRGELSRGALSLKSMRKRLYIAFLRGAGFLNDVEWHASTTIEANEIKRALRLREHASVHVATDLNFIPDEQNIGVWRPREPDAPLRVCFLSRISPKKNLLGAIRALAKMKKPAHLTVHGPKEDADYWTECEHAARSLPKHIGFSYGGTINRHDVYQSLSRYDVFFLPTLGENFGHVIAEALSVGLPIVISDTTPWRGLVEKGLGYDGPLDEGTFAHELDKIATLGPGHQEAMRTRCRQFARMVLTDPSAVEQNRNLFMANLTTQKHTVCRAEASLSARDPA